jgi:prepilin-type N-terminal cleavage/methylation domain-containing protein
MSTRIPRPARRARPAFSLIEVLVSLVITSTLLTAVLAALDASFKAYKVTTESASTNVVARLVTARLGTMIRTGTDFGPYPADVLDAAQNPMDSTFMEFAGGPAPGGATKIIRLERRGTAAPYELWYIETHVLAGVPTLSEERPLLTGVQELSFRMEYDVGPRLRRATLDMTIKPNDYQDAKFSTQLETPTIRFVSSFAPRKLD